MGRKVYERQEGLEEGLKKGLEEGLERGREEGSVLKLIQQIIKKLGKGKTPDIISDELEENPSDVTVICKVIEEFTPPYDCELIYERLRGKSSQ